MGFLDEMANKAAEKILRNSSSPMASAALEMINSHPGGISGLVQVFHDKGLGDVVNSWVSTGQNLPISADQIQSVLGNEGVKQLAAKAGTSPDAVGEHLAQLLPQIVDRLTPNGNLSDSNSLLQQGLNFLKSKS